MIFIVFKRGEVIEMKLTAIACFLTIVSVTGENVCPQGEEYTLLMKDSYGDGWDDGGLQLQANFTNGESLQYYLDSGSTASFNLCQIVTLEVSQEPGLGSWDHSEASYSLIRGEETIFESVANSTRPHRSGVVWANCPDGQGWNGTACGSCADNQIITDDICTDCPPDAEGVDGVCKCTQSGFELVGGVCSCTDEYTLVMEDSHGDGWDTNGLQLQATLTNGTSRTFALPYSSNRNSKYGDVNLCQIVALEVSRRPGSYDNNESSYSLTRGDETIFESSATPTRPHTFGLVWVKCPDGKGWTGTACASCADNQIITDDICTDCPAGEEAEGNECICNGKAYTLLMKDSYGDGWESNGLQLQANFTNGESLKYYLDSGSTASFNLCQIVTLEVSQEPGSASWDHSEASYSLIRGEETIFESVANSTRPHTTGVVWAIVLMDKCGTIQHVHLVQIIKL